MFTYPKCPKCRSEAKRSDVPYGHASMLLLGEESEATEPYNKYDKIRPHSTRSLQFDQNVRPLSFRPEKFELFTATQKSKYESECPKSKSRKMSFCFVTLFQGSWLIKTRTGSEEVYNNLGRLKQFFNIKKP